MAFFNLKDDDEYKHIGIGIFWQFNDDPKNCKIENYEWNGKKEPKYKLSLKYKGTSSLDGCVRSFKNNDGDWFYLKEGDDYEFTATEYLYGLLAEYSKGDGVSITTNKNGVKRDYVIKPLLGISSDDNTLNEFADKGTDKPVKIVSNGSLGITWGMSINNATQLMIAKGIDEKSDIIEELEKTASKIMDVAVHGLTRWEQDQHEKDQNSAPNDDDVPF